ncbi:MAG: hypothetical protein Q9173_006474 [Seirophora scorigena]
MIIVSSLRWYLSRPRLLLLGGLTMMLEILTYGLDITSFFAIRAGSGRHMITLTLDQITSLIKTDQATQVLFGCSITATKLSILFFYLRLFPFRTFFVVSLITGVAALLWWVGLMLTAFLHCRPLAYYWDRSIPNGYCVDEHLIGFTITSVNIVTDLVVLVLPIPWLWGMNMAVPKRMAVVGLFVLGSFVCIAGIVRIPLLAELKFSDISWTSVSVGVWVNVECNIGILSACLPILRPLFSTKYPSSPVSYFTRIIRTATHSTLFSSTNGGGSSSDPEKGGAASEPSSDATAAEGFRWPNDSPAKGWRWSRDNSASTAALAPQPRPPPARPTAKERERKHRTWYSAAADVVPEIDFASRRFSREVAQIPRYRDDVEKPVISPTLSPRTFRTERSVEKSPPPPPLPSPPSSPRVRQNDTWPGALQPHTTSTSHVSSQRSSWGMGRDTWDLMPSIRRWDRAGLVKAMDL